MNTASTSLAVLVATALTVSLEHESFASQPAATVPVTIAPGEGEGVELREIVGMTSVVAYSRGGAVSGQAIHYQTLCVAPCTANVQPGAKLVITGDDFPSSSVFRAPRTEAHLAVAPGSSAGAYGGSVATIFGGTGIILGATFLITSLLVSGQSTDTFRNIGLASLGGGAVLTGAGIYLTYVSATRVNDERGERIASVGYRGRF